MAATRKREREEQVGSTSIGTQTDDQATWQCRLSLEFLVERESVPLWTTRQASDTTGSWPVLFCNSCRLPAAAHEMRRSAPEEIEEGTLTTPTKKRGPKPKLPPPAPNLAPPLTQGVTPSATRMLL
jgi:hypothetical protein